MHGSRIRLAVAVALVVVVAVGVVILSHDRTGSSGTTATATLAVGAVAPPVRLVATTGQTVDISAFRGKRDVLLYFYEHAG